MKDSKPSSKAKVDKHVLKAKKETVVEHNEQTIQPTLNKTDLKRENLEVDKENLTEVHVIKVEDTRKKVTSKAVTRRAQFKKRPIKKEEEILSSFLEKGLDKEDVLMMKLAFVKLKGKGDEMVEGMDWAYYPHNILSLGRKGERREREGGEGGGGGGGERERSTETSHFKCTFLDIISTSTKCPSPKEEACHVDGEG